MLEEVFFIIFLVTGVLSGIILFFLYEKIMNLCDAVFRKDVPSNIIRSEALYVPFGITGILYFSVMGAFALVSPSCEFEIKIVIMCVILILLSIAMGTLLAYFVWKIEVFDDYFIYTNLFGIKKKYYYSEIKMVWIQDIYPRVYKGKRRLFTIAPWHINDDVLVEKYLKNGYKIEDKKPFFKWKR